MSQLDPLSDIMRVLRVGGSLVLNDTYALPWSVSVPAAARLAELTRIAEDEVVAFHLVQRGWLRLTDDAGSQIEAGRGDLLVCFGGGPHEISSGDGATSTPLENLMGLADNPHDGIDSDQPATTLLCGVFSLGRFRTSPMAAGLPRIAHIRGGATGDFDALANLLATEVIARRPGMEFTVGRLLELICAEALRHVAREAAGDRPSWLRSMTDPAVFAAMSAVHQDPSAGWDMRALGEAATMSPSRLTARFRETLGQSPMAYVTEWRMIIAAQLLTDTQLSVQQVAERVGYTAQPSFTRAFTRHYGVAPRPYRAGSELSHIQT